MSAFEKIRRDRAWVLKMADAEEGASVGVGGLYGRLQADHLHAARRTLAQFVELSRRQLGLTPAELAAQAKMDLSELLSLETGMGAPAGRDSIARLAAVLKVDAEPLLELAGLSPALDSRLGSAAVEFAARLEPVAPLEAREQEALNWFKDEIFKRRTEAVG
jgi:hypothetical protein